MSCQLILNKIPSKPVSVTGDRFQIGLDFNRNKSEQTGQVYQLNERHWLGIAGVPSNLELCIQSEWQLGSVVGKDFFQRDKISKDLQMDIRRNGIGYRYGGGY